MAQPPARASRRTLLLFSVYAVTGWAGFIFLSGFLLLVALSLLWISTHFAVGRAITCGLVVTAVVSTGAKIALRLSSPRDGAC